MPDNDFQIEILPNISITDDRSQDDFDVALNAYRAEMKASGYEYDTDALQRDVGEFRYPDPANPRNTKTVIMGADPGLVTDRDVGDKPPTCTSNYPTLDEQWKEQCKIVSADPRLQKLVGEPKKFPPTKVIPSISMKVRP